MAIDARVPAGASRFAPAPGAFGSRADDGRASLASELLCELDPSSRSRRPVRRAMTEALLAFASVGASRCACQLAQDALELAREQVAMFEAAPEDPAPEERRELFAVLRDLDSSPLLESAILPNLLALDCKPADAAASIPAVEELHDRLCHQFLCGRPPPWFLLASGRCTPPSVCADCGPSSTCSTWTPRRVASRASARPRSSDDGSPLPTLVLRVWSPILRRCSVARSLPRWPARSRGSFARKSAESGRCAPLRGSSAGRSRSFQDSRRGGKSSRI